MEFKYDDTPDEVRKPVAWLYRMEGPYDPESDLALCLATNSPDKFVWAYSDGEFTIQSTPPSGEALKVFYGGDSLTITF